MSSTINYIAKTCHEANKAFCESIGDKSQVSWDESEKWQKESTILGVKAILDNPFMTPSMTHQSWFDTKVKDGWVYGEVKDSTLKTHPCMVSYDKLPVSEKSKDYIFRAIVLAMSNNI